MLALAPFLPMSAKDRRSEYIGGLASAGYPWHRLVSQLEGKALYSPDIYVVTDPFTFSAAYDLMFHLWRMGAKLVGVPPSQSASTFVDPSPFTLPNTGLQGAVSRTAVTYSGAREAEGAFTMDYPMEWAVFRKHGFDLHSEILAILDR